MAIRTCIVMRNIRSGNMPYRCAFFLGTFSLVVLFLLAGNVFAKSPKGDNLREKLREISSLRWKMSEVNVQFYKIREQFEEQMQELKAEIKHEKVRSEIMPIKKAIHLPRIIYNLKLIQQTLFYLSRIEEKISYIRNGNDELEFLYHQVRDNLRIINMLTKKEVETLMDQTNQGLSKFLSETYDISFNHDDMANNLSENIWNKIIKEK